MPMECGKKRRLSSHRHTGTKITTKMVMESCSGTCWLSHSAALWSHQLSTPLWNFTGHFSPLLRLWMNTDADPSCVVPSQELNLWLHGHSYQTTGIDLAQLNVWLSVCASYRVSYFKDVCALVCVWVFAHLFLYLPTWSFQNDLLISVVDFNSVCVRVCVSNSCMPHTFICHFQFCQSCHFINS